MARQLRVLVTGINDYNKAAAPVAPTGYNLQSLPAAVNAPIFDSQGWCASDCGLRSYTEATDPSYAVNKVCFRRSI
jgi:hypothetical protein